MKKKPIKLVCQKCKHEWNYKGSKGTKPFTEYTPCPRCRILVKVKKLKHKS